MNNNKSIYGAIAITFIVAVLALFLGLGHSATGKLGAVSVTTNLPSLGVAQLAVGSGCDQQYTTCTGLSIDSSGNITTSGNITASSAIAVGGVYSTTTISAILSVNSMIGISTVLFTPVNGSAVTLTLLGSSSLTTFIPNVGDRTSIQYYNSSSTGPVVTFAGGTGTTLVTASSTKAMGPGGTAMISFVRVATGLIVATIHAQGN